MFCPCLPLLYCAPCALSLGSHTLTITCTCCYDEGKGIQDQDLFSCSFSDSLSGLSVLLALLLRVCLRVQETSSKWGLHAECASEPDSAAVAASNSWALQVIGCPTELQLGKLGPMEILIGDSVAAWCGCWCNTSTDSQHTPSRHKQRY